MDRRTFLKGAGMLGASTALFQAPQPEQRPNQRDSSLPQAEQKKWGLAGFGKAPP